MNSDSGWEKQIVPGFAIFNDDLILSTDPDFIFLEGDKAQSNSNTIGDHSNIFEKSSFQIGHEGAITSMGTYDCRHQQWSRYHASVILNSNFANIKF